MEICMRYYYNYRFFGLILYYNYTAASSGIRGTKPFALHLLYLYCVNIHTSLVLF